MCRSRAEGGQRCHAHTSKAVAAAVAEVQVAESAKKQMFDRAVGNAMNDVPETRIERRARENANRRVTEAQARLSAALIAHASTPQGSREVLAEAISHEVLAGRARHLKDHEAHLMRALELRDAVKRGEALREINQRVAAVARERRDAGAGGTAVAGREVQTEPLMAGARG